MAEPPGEAGISHSLQLLREQKIWGKFPGPFNATIQIGAWEVQTFFGGEKGAGMDSCLRTPSVLILSSEDVGGPHHAPGP